jgi:hypothetical protein
MQRGQEGVVEADDRDVGRHADARVLQAVEHPRRRQVVGGEDGGRQLGPLEHPLGRLHAGDLGELPAHQARLGREPRVAHRALEARPPRRGARAGAPVDVHDPPVPEGDEVLDREARAHRLVRVDAVDRRRPQRAADDHDRGVPRRGHDLLGRQPRGDEDDPVRPGLEQRVEHRPLARHPAAPRGDQDAVAEPRGVVLDPACDLREVRVVQVVEQHADRVGAPARQAPRDRVGAVAEAGRGGQDALATLG